MSLIELIGILGALLLIVAWIPELKEIIKKKKSKLNKRFSQILLIATFLLLVYSVLIEDFIFTIINGFLLFEISISFYYTVLKS